jgi:hypothetical protein
MVLPGALLVYAAWSSGVIVPGLLGTPLILLGLLIFANPAWSNLKLASGMLVGRSLLGRRAIPVDQITRIVPVRLTYQRTILMPWKRSAEMFDVCTKDGPTGLWLNPNLYGAAPIQNLVQAIGREPEGPVEDRVLEVSA